MSPGSCGGGSSARVAPIPDYLKSDVTRMEMLSAISSRSASGDTFRELGLGVEIRGSDWLRISVGTPYKFISGTDEVTGTPLTVDGIGDITLAATISATRLAGEPGDLTAGITVSAFMPTGRSDIREGTNLLPARYQPGRGSWTFGINAELGKDYGRGSVSAAAGYLSRTSGNSSGYSYAPHVTWRIGTSRRLKKEPYAQALALEGDIALEDDELYGVGIDGTKGSALSARLSMLYLQDRGLSSGISIVHALNDTRDNARRGTEIGAFVMRGF